MTTKAVSGRLLRDEMDAELTEQARQAIVTNKPTMVAYYVRMRKAMRDNFGAPGTQTSNEAIVTRARAILAKAAAECPVLAKKDVQALDDACRLWAVSVYCANLLRKMGQTVSNRDLTWLRDLEKKL